MTNTMNGTKTVISVSGRCSGCEARRLIYPPCLHSAAITSTFTYRGRSLPGPGTSTSKCPELLGETGRRESRSALLWLPAASADHRPDVMAPDPGVREIRG